MPLTILVVDDDLGTRLAIGDYLESVGYAVVQAANGAEAIARLDECQPHLIVTDVAMPQMDGYEFVRLVRQQPAWRLLPVVFLSARSETSDRILGYQIGGDVYLPKPFELQELGVIVRNLLERLQMIEWEWRSRRPPTSAPDNAEAVAQQAAQVAALDFTEREKDVLLLLAEGLSNIQIGDRLHLSPRTIEKYVSSLLNKTNTSNRSELLRFAVDRHLV